MCLTLCNLSAIPFTSNCSQSSAVLSYTLKQALRQSPRLFSFQEERARRAPRRIKFDDQREEEVADLEACMAPIFREDLYKRLTSAEFKDHVAALDLLTKGVPQYIKAMTDNLDVLLRWSVVRICEANTSSMLKVGGLHGAVLARTRVLVFAGACRIWILLILPTWFVFEPTLSCRALNIESTV